ncbi:MAG: nuclear transport factor 2 family protein [Caulobacter sp.]|nr:nuclear transport factor 2 family protein [Caulobacter sp.]
MRRLPIALVASLILAGPAFAGPSDEARKGLAAQVEAWNRDDMDGALALYWNAPDIVWVNRRGLERGFVEFARAMRAEAAANPDLGDYQVEVLDSRDLGPDSALLVIRWSISRDGKRLMGGISTQIWRQIDGLWVVVFEHAS